MTVTPVETLTEVAGTARSAGGTVHEIPCDLSRLADVRAAAATAQDSQFQRTALTTMVLLDR